MNAPDPNAKPRGFANLIGWIVLLALIGLAAVILIPKLDNKSGNADSVETSQPQAVQPEAPAKKKSAFDTR